MRPLTSTFTALLLTSGLLVAASALTGSPTAAEPAGPPTASGAAVERAESIGHTVRRDFDRFLERYEAANEAFANGDPTLWLAMTTEHEPASIFGGFGGLGDAGVAEVHHRYLLAARAFVASGAEVDVEYLVKDVQGRIAYTVAIERSEVQYAARTEKSPQVLRVTMTFRYEHGGWTIVHRHADTMIELELPR